MKTYAVPIDDHCTATVRVGEELEVHDGLATVRWSLENGRVTASNGVSHVDVTNQLTKTLASLTALHHDASEPFMRLWLSERLDCEYTTSIEGVLEQGVPSLHAIYQRHDGLARVSSVSTRLWEALTAGDTPREIASNYWGDSSTRSDGTAFVDALKVGNSLDESRVALMGLVPPGDERRKLVAVPTSTIWMIPPRAVAEVASELAVPAAVAFAAEAIRDPRSRLQLTAAHVLRIKAAGNDGALAYRHVLDDVLRSDFAAPRTLAERIVASGPVEEWPIAQVTTDRGLAVVAKAARNCLANPSYPWRSRVLRGEVALLTVGEVKELAAVLAIDPTTGVIVEMRGRNNAEVPPPLASAISRRIEQVAGKL